MSLEVLYWVYVDGAPVYRTGDSALADRRYFKEVQNYPSKQVEVIYVEKRSTIRRRSTPIRLEAKANTY